MKAPPGSLAFLHCLEANKGAFPKVQDFPNFCSQPSAFILNPRRLQNPEDEFPMELFGSGITSSKPLELSCALKDSSSLTSSCQREGDLRGVVRMSRKAAVLCSRGFKVPRDLTSDSREGGFQKSIEVAGSSASCNCAPESTRSCKNPT